jgi:hypothetical protein
MGFLLMSYFQLAFLAALSHPADFARTEAANLFILKSGSLAKITEAPGGVFVHCCSSSKVGPQITDRDTTTHLQWSWLLTHNTLLR